MQNAAAKALGQMHAVEPLIAAPKDSSVGMAERQAAAQALGQVGDGRAVEPLIAALNDLDLNLRSDAAEALGKLGDKRAVEPLAVALKDPFAKVSQAASNALRKLGNVDLVGSFLRDDRDTFPELPHRNRCFYGKECHKTNREIRSHHGPKQNLLLSQDLPRRYRECRVQFWRRIRPK